MLIATLLSIGVNNKKLHYNYIVHVYRDFIIQDPHGDD